MKRILNFELMEQLLPETTSLLVFELSLIVKFVFLPSVEMGVPPQDEFRTKKFRQTLLHWKSLCVIPIYQLVFVVHQVTHSFANILNIGSLLSFSYISHNNPGCIQPTIYLPCASCGAKGKIHKPKEIKTMKN